MLEIERKYLVLPQHWSGVQADSSEPVLQGYLISEGAFHLRVRLRGNQGFITLKDTSAGTVRHEFEYPVPAAEAEEIITRFATHLITKTRHTLMHQGKRWEVDEFHGNLQGLFLAEIELRSADEAFELPDWADLEVTHDPRYRNAALAKTGIPERDIS